MTDQPSRRRELYGLLGDLPLRDRPITATHLHHEDADSYELQKLSLDLNGIEAVPAYFVKPIGARGRLPVVLFNHSHGGNYVIGKRN